ncbi:17945_t:CDS:2, partial [Funneliformis geosporum]
DSWYDACGERCANECRERCSKCNRFFNTGELTRPSTYNVPVLSGSQISTIQNSLDTMIERSGGKNEYEYKIEVKTEKVSLEVGRDVVPTESFQQGERSVFPSEVSGLDLGIDLSQNREISVASFSLIERPASSSEKGKVLWERKIVKDRQNDSEVLNEREDDSVVPTVKEDYEGSQEEVSENLTNQEEVIIRSSNSRRLTDGGQVNFVEYQQVSPMDIDQSSPESPSSETDFKRLLSDDEIEKADREQLEDLKRRVEAELEIRRQVEADSSSSSQKLSYKVSTQELRNKLQKSEQLLSNYQNPSLDNKDNRGKVGIITAIAGVSTLAISSIVFVKSKLQSKPR